MKECNQSPEPILFTASEAAKALAISQRTLWSRTQAGDIPHLRIGRSVRYPKTQILNWITQHVKGGAE